jgi:hypothetical protein
VYNKNQDKSYRSGIWWSIDPLKVKQRIEKITHRLETVRRQFESSEAKNSSDNKEGH